MTLTSLIALDKLRAVWSERHPKTQAQLGLTAQRVSHFGRRGTSFAWRDYIANESRPLIWVPDEEAIEVATILLDELHRLREQERKPKLVVKKAKGAAA